MGTRHAALGALAAAATLPVAHAMQAPPLLWAAAWIGGSLLPDLDMHTSTAVRLWGAPTRIVGALVGEAAGGHRARTHNILAAPAATAAVGSVALLWRPAAFILTAFVIGLALRVTAPVHHRVLRRPVPNLAVSAALSWLIVGQDTPLWWAPLVCSAAVALHIIGDSLTNEGAPWPLGRGPDWGARMLTCGRGIERALAWPMIGGAAWLAWLNMT